MKNGSPRLRQMPGSSSGQTPRFSNHTPAGVLAETEWPRETLVAFEVKPELSAVLLDVDLAEIEDFPDKIYGVNARGTELTEKAMTQKAVRENYARHVHGCLFRPRSVSFYIRYRSTT